MVELEEGIRRITFRLTLGIDHVHCYFLRASSGAWILVDTGLGGGDPEADWQPVLDALDAPVERIVVTHLHPDHLGGARDVAALTGALVYQGREDRHQSLDAWGGEDRIERLARHWSQNGLPPAQLNAVVAEARRIAGAVRLPTDVQVVDPGDSIDGWRVEVLRGHADGHIVLLRDGVMIAGDTILAKITPAIGLVPMSRPDPLGDYLGTLRRVETLALRVAYAGHGSVIRDPSGRATEIDLHHRARLDVALGALGDVPQSAYDVSLSLFAPDLSAAQRRFALTESLAHLEYLVFVGRASRVEGGYVRG